MQKIYKYIPYCAYAILLLIIAALCIAITNPFPLASPNGEQNGDGVLNPDTTEDTSGEIDTPVIPPNEENPNDTPIPDTPADVPPPVEYTDEIPRQALEDEVYSYSQKIYGNGTTTLEEVVQTSVGVFAIVTTNSTKGDVYGDNQCVGVVKLDGYGNILNAVSLNYSSASRFITAFPTSKGLVLVTSTNDNSSFYVHILTYDLHVSPAYRISAANGGKIIPTTNSFLFFAEYSDETLVYAYNGNGFNFQSVCSGEIAEVFEYGTYYMLFSSNKSDNSYSIIKLSKSELKVLSEIKCSSAVCIDVFPIMSDGSQAFIVIEDRNGVVWAKKYLDNTFTTVQDAKKIGNFSVRGAYFNASEILVACQGNLNGIIAINSDLSTKYHEISSDFIPQNILDGTFHNGTLYYLATDESGKLALSYSKDEVSYFEHFDITTDYAKFIINLDGSFTIFYQQDKEVRVIGIK